MSSRRTKTTPRKKKTHRVNLNVIVHVLRLNRQQQRPKPFKRVEVTTDPEEIDLPQARLLPRVRHPVPDALEDRRERRHADARPDQHRHLVLEHILRRRAERSVDVQSRQDLAERAIDPDAAGDPVDSDHLGRVGAPAPLLLLAAKGASQRLGERFREIPHASDVDGDVVFFGSAGQREGMILPQGYLRAAQEDVLDRHVSDPHPTRRLRDHHHHHGDRTCPARVLMLSFLI